MTCPRWRLSTGIWYLPHPQCIVIDVKENTCNSNDANDEIMTMTCPRWRLSTGIWYLPHTQGIVIDVKENNSDDSDKSDDKPMSLMQ
jgi:hypothetical protein